MAVTGNVERLHIGNNVACGVEIISQFHRVVVGRVIHVTHIFHIFHIAVRVVDVIA